MVADHKASAAKQWARLGGKKKQVVEIEDGPACPRELIYLWNYFSEVSCGIASGGFGPAVVTWTDLYSWRWQMGIDLLPWEARAIIDLGSLRAVIASEKPPTAQPS